MNEIGIKEKTKKTVAGRYGRTDHEQIHSTEADVCGQHVMAEDEKALGEKQTQIFAPLQTSSRGRGTAKI